jgi:hypothetical protein
MNYEMNKNFGVWSFGQRKQPIEPNQIKFQTTEQARVAGMMVYRRF